MISGSCQHRVCARCLYDENGVLRSCFNTCPTCSASFPFPIKSPVVPAVVVETQRCLGVMSCPNKGCKAEMWFWEVEEHNKSCPEGANSKSTPAKSANRKRRLSDRGPVSITRRTLRANTKDERQLRPRVSRTQSLSRR